MKLYMEKITGSVDTASGWVGYEKIDGTHATMSDVEEDIKAGRLIEVRKTTAVEKAEYGDWIDADI